MWNKRTARRRRSIEPIQALEDRCLLASNLTATFNAGVLRVEGTPNADQIVIQNIGSEIKVNALSIKNAAGKTVKAPANQVKSLSIDALDGNDLIWIKGNLNLPFDLTAGAGADLVALGPATKITSSDLGPFDSKQDTSTGLWKQLEAATRDPQGTITINKLDVPSGIPGLPNVSLTNVKLKVTADSIELVNGTFKLPVLGSTVTLRGVMKKDGQFDFASEPIDNKIGGVALKSFKATVTNDKITYQGLVQHKFLGNNPISVNGNVNTTSGTYSLIGAVPNRTLFNGNLALSNQTVSLDKDGLKFTTDATFTKLGIIAKFEGTLLLNGKYSLTAGFNGNIAGVSVKAEKVFTWDSDQGIKANFAANIAGMPPDTSGQTATFSFSGTYGPDNWSITGVYNKPIELGYVTLTDITVTINKNRVNANDFVEVSCIGSYQGWKALANVKGTARFYRDGRYTFTADGSLIDTAKLTSEFGGYKVSGTTVVTTNTQVSQNAKGEYVINESVKTGTVSTVVNGNFKAGGFELSRFSGIINSNGFYKFQSVDRIPLPWGGIDIARTTIYLEKGNGLTFASTADIGRYRFTEVTGNLTPDGRLIINGSNGSLNGLAISSSSLRGEFDSSSKRYSITISGTVNTPLGNASIGTRLDGSGAVPAPNLTFAVSLSGPITKLFTGSVTVNLGNSPSSFSGKVGVKGLDVSKSISGSFTSSGTVTINGVSFTPSGLSNPTTAAKLLIAIGVTDPLQIARALQKNITTSFSDIADSLWKSGAMAGKKALDLAKVLVNAGAGASSIATAFGQSGLGFSWTTIADSLWKSGAMAGKKALDLAKALVNAGAGASSIATAFGQSGLGFSWTTIADSLWKSGAMAGKKALDLAKALVNAGAGASSIATAFGQSGLGFSWTTIAESLWNSGAMAGKKALDLARVLRNAGAGFDSTVDAIRGAVGLDFLTAWRIVNSL